MGRPIIGTRGLQAISPGMVVKIGARLRSARDMALNASLMVILGPHGGLGPRPRTMVEGGQGAVDSSPRSDRGCPSPRRAHQGCGPVAS